MTLLRVLLLLGLCSSAAFAQSTDVAYPDGFDGPFPYFAEALGTHGYPISSAVDSAQVFFNQGVQMMYAFTKEDAARSFREAQRRDPSCAICHWGEAWAWGPYLNGKMRPAEAPRAYAALQHALALRDQASAKERALIDAMQVRYVADGYTRDEQAARDTAYAEALRGVYAQYPDDLDIGTLYAESLFLLEPRLGTRDVNDPDIQRLHGVLQAILDRDIRHPGACHLYIHATESTQDPGLAEGCAEYIGSSIPGASHINHMPSHTWNEIGRWPDAVRANIQAWHSDQKAAIGQGFAIYPSHNLHMLLFAASMDGQGGLASQAGRDYHTLTGNAMYAALTLLRFGRFDEVLAVDDRPDHPVQGGLWDFAQGYAHLKTGAPEFAQAYLTRVLTAADTSTARFRFHPARLLLGTVGGILEGELAWQAERLDDAEAAFRRAVVLEDRLTYDEPEPLPFAARHWLGALLLDQARYAEAEQVYRDELADRPNNGWSLFGLNEALNAQGRPDPAVQAAFEASWARSDTWIRGSRF